MSFLFIKVEDVTTISKSQSLTSVSIKDCTLRVPPRVIIKAIIIITLTLLYLHVHTHACARTHTTDHRDF